ncbi:HNH endonuclease [Noviherbaspirillum pedocola]|uniref:HNH endonuclease n=1 Tax=Noviherbaspirillum pedocola TaxID=2801341 RepID=A0A934T007_9BURK|nr:HNH endonuclease signature motif containing protein [Noviherbaspirillum pedocola]MBK4736202.1 HNH endonuclease [Noviherbaspirillum pedocola]
MDRTVKHWKDVPKLHKLPLLAINVKNDTQERLDKNEPLFKQGKAGDWHLPAEVIASPKDTFVMLFYGVRLRDKLKENRSIIYVGKITRIKECESAGRRPRYVISIEKPWQKVAMTDVNFKQFMEGFVFSPQSATHWIDGRLASSVPQLRGAEVRQMAREGQASVEAVVLRRMGHHQYAREVKDKWDNRCALTGADSGHLLEAAHLIPWDHSGSGDNVNANNGLCLCSHLHRMLDRFQIAFDGNGRLHMDRRLSTETRDVLLASGHIKLRETNHQAELRKFLDKHFANAKLENPDLRLVRR